MLPWLPGPLRRWFDATYARSVHATSEALYPEAPGIPGGVSTELAPRTMAYIDQLPPTQRPMVALLFVAVEWLPFLMWPLGGRLSRRTAERRVATVEGWRHSRIWPLRLVGDALRATLTMVYFSHPKVLAVWGEPPEGDPTVPLEATP